MCVVVISPVLSWREKGNESESDRNERMRSTPIHTIFMINRLQPSKVYSIKFVTAPEKWSASQWNICSIILWNRFAGDFSPYFLAWFRHWLCLCVFSWVGSNELLSTLFCLPYGLLREQKKNPVIILRTTSRHGEENVVVIVVACFQLALFAISLESCNLIESPYNRTTTKTKSKYNQMSHMPRHKGIHNCFMTIYEQYYNNWTY